MKFRYVLFCVLLSACSESADPTPWDLAENNTNNTTANNTATNNTATNNVAVNNTMCEGAGFYCVRSCSTSFALDSVCVEGGWKCPEEDGPWFPLDQCSECLASSSSSVPGVTLVLEPDRCVWTLEELSRGIKIPYVVTIQSETSLIPIAQDDGGCGRPDESGLVVFFEITGDDEQRYCLCDVGLCPRVQDSVMLVPGVYRRTIEWNGTNWTGPSDTGNPYGPLFKPGEATLTVTAAYLDASGEQRYITSRMSIQIL